MAGRHVYYVLGVGPGMREHLAGAKEVVEALADDHTHRGSDKDEMALLLVGTEGTLSTLYTQLLEGNDAARERAPDYEHITLAHPPSPPTASASFFYTRLRDAQPGPGGGDILSALAVAVDASVRRQRKGTTRVVLISDGSEDPGSVDAATVDVIEGLRDQNASLELNIIGVGFDFAAGTCDPDTAAARNTLALFNALREAYTAARCECVTLEQARAAALRPRANAQAPGRALIADRLQLTEACWLDVELHIVARATKPQQYGKFSIPGREQAEPAADEAGAAGAPAAESDPRRVDPVTAFRVDKDSSSVGQPGQIFRPEELMNGYRYGNMFVPVTDLDLLGGPGEELRSLKAVAFCPAEAVPRHHFLGYANALVAKKGSGHEEPFAALVRATAARGLVFVVRMVRVRNERAKHLVCVPQVEEDEEGERCYFLTSDLPYSNDVRDYRWAGGQRRPSAAQVAAAEGLVAAMALEAPAAAPESHEAAEDRELLRPEDLPCPWQHHERRNIAARAKKPGAPLLDADEGTLSLLRLPPTLAASPAVADAARAFTEACPTTQPTGAADGGRKRPMMAFLDDEPPPEAKRATLDPEAGGAIDILGGGASRRAPLSAAPDAPAALLAIVRDATDTPEEALAEMEQLIESLRDGVGLAAETREKAVACARALREAVVDLQDPERFAGWLRAVKEGGGALWEALRAARVTLLRQGECEGGVPDAEADAFVAAPGPAAQGAQGGAVQGEEDDEEDLNELE